MCKLYNKYLINLEINIHINIVTYISFQKILIYVNLKS